MYAIHSPPLHIVCLILALPTASSHYQEESRLNLMSPRIRVHTLRACILEALKVIAR